MEDGSATRLHILAGLVAGAEVAIDAAQAHRLRHVLRLKPGAAVAAFNAEDGEFLCRIVALERHGGRLAAERRLRAPMAPEPDLWLVFAPIKRVRLDWLVEKASELGAAALLPVHTARTQAGRVGIGRLRAIAVAAAEQSGRLSVPEVHAPARLDRLLAAWPAQRRLFACDETGAGVPLAAAFGGAAPLLPAALLIGPEGGFTETELDAIGKLPFVTRIGLGPRILRAETAALAALAVFQAVGGDWRHLPAG